MRTDTNLGATACSQYEQRLAEYLAGELDPIYTRRVEQHMAECAELPERVRERQGYFPPVQYRGALF